jgi:dTDP-4-amino-4,6-dideoxygalactose transaminase
MSHDRPVIPITRPWLGEAEAEAAQGALLSGWVTQGPEVAAFEQEFAAYVGARHACAVSSCTTALHLALLAVGVRPGDEVITASHSFIATANSIRYCGATPVFVDVQPRTFNLEPALLAPAITTRTRAILCVHQLGMPCDLDAIVAVAQRHGLPVIEDAACAIGSEIRWQGVWEKIGRPHGDIACFSFHPRKVITTGDGGMLTTANREWDRQFRLWRQHGMSVPDTTRHGARSVLFEDYPVLGYNYRMTDIQAAIGREQLKRLPEIIHSRRLRAESYRRRLASIPGLGLPEEPAWARSNWQSFCVRLPASCNQLRVMQCLLDRGVASRRGVMCAHREPAYAVDGTCRIAPDRSASGPLPVSEQAQNECIIVPLFPQMTDAELAAVVASLREACGPVGTEVAHANHSGGQRSDAA